MRGPICCSRSRQSKLHSAGAETREASSRLELRQVKMWLRIYAEGKSIEACTADDSSAHNNTEISIPSLLFAPQIESFIGAQHSR